MVDIATAKHKIKELLSKISAEDLADSVEEWPDATEPCWVPSEVVLGAYLVAPNVLPEDLVTQIENSVECLRELDRITSDEKTFQGYNYPGVADEMSGIIWDPATEIPDESLKPGAMVELPTVFQIFKGLDATPRFEKRWNFDPHLVMVTEDVKTSASGHPFYRVAVVTPVDKFMLVDLDPTDHECILEQDGKQWWVHCWLQSPVAETDLKKGRFRGEATITEECSKLLNPESGGWCDNGYDEVTEAYHTYLEHRASSIPMTLDALRDEWEEEDDKLQYEKYKAYRLEREADKDSDQT